MSALASGIPLWQPSMERIQQSNLAAFQRAVFQQWGRKFDDYAELHRWSVESPEEFWVSLWDFARIEGERGESVLIDGD